MPKVRPLAYSDYDEEMDIKYTKKGYEYYGLDGYRMVNRETGEEIGIVYKKTSHSVGTRGETVWCGKATNGVKHTNRIESPTREGVASYVLTDYLDNKYDG